jgi:hypothetical protein
MAWKRFFRTTTAWFCHRGSRCVLSAPHIITKRRAVIVLHGVGPIFSYNDRVVLPSRQPLCPERASHHHEAPCRYCVAWRGTDFFVQRPRVFAIAASSFRDSTAVTTHNDDLAENDPAQNLPARGHVVTASHPPSPATRREARRRQAPNARRCSCRRCPCKCYTLMSMSGSIPESSPGSEHRQKKHIRLR